MGLAMDELDTPSDERGREHKRAEVFDQAVIAVVLVCFIFAVVGFYSQGLVGAFNFAWTAFISSVILFIAVAEECSVTASTLIVCGVFGAIGLIAGGMTGAFYGVGLAFSAAVLLFSTLRLLQRAQSARLL